MKLFTSGILKLFFVGEFPKKSSDKEYSFMMEYLQAKMNYSLLMMQDDVWKLYLNKHLKMNGLKDLVIDSK